MKKNIKVGTELSLWAIWLGSLWVLALLVAPALFKWLPRAEAGLVAGRFFYLLSWYSLFTAVLLLWLSKLEDRWVLFGVLVVCLLELCWLHPKMGVIRQTLQTVSAEELLELKASFGHLHKVSSALYALKMIAALAWGVRRFGLKSKYRYSQTPPV